MADKGSDNKVALSFQESDFQLLEKERCYDGFFKVDKLTLRHKRFTGGEVGPIERELFIRDDATCLLPYDPEQDKVVLLEQFRVGAIRQGHTPWLLELVAGINDPGETPETVARREAKEEAGIQVGELIKICDYFASPGGCCERVSLFCGKVDSATAKGFHGLPEEGEDIRVVVMNRQKAYELVQQGVIDNAASIMALQWLQLNYRDLQSRWLDLSEI